MRKFQIRLVDSKKCGTFLYFEARHEDSLEKIKELAEEKANEFLEKKREREKDRFVFPPSFLDLSRPYKPFRTISVVEYDNDKKSTKRGGIKFKLRLSYIKTKTRILNEWYEAD